MLIKLKQFQKKKKKKVEVDNSHLKVNAKKHQKDQVR